MSLHVSVVCCQQSLLWQTVLDAYAKAVWPDRLHFGVVLRGDVAVLEGLSSALSPSQIERIAVPASDWRGRCWARSVAMSLVGDQDWFCQVDAGTLFVQNWDAILIDQANVLLGVGSSCVLTAEPPMCTVDPDGALCSVGSWQTLRAHVVAPGQHFSSDDPTLRFSTRTLDGFAAVEGFHIAAGALFSSAEFVQHFPWDPYLCASTEESSMALRLFTSGWTIYHPREMPLHRLVPSQTSGCETGEWPKPLGEIQTEFEDDFVRSAAITVRARRRMNELVSGDSSALGVYGLGRERSLQDYAGECGIDYVNRQVLPKAYVGPWVSRPAPRPEA